MVSCDCICLLPLLGTGSDLVVGHRRFSTEQREPSSVFWLLHTSFYVFQFFRSSSGIRPRTRAGSHTHTPFSSFSACVAFFVNGSRRARTQAAFGLSLLCTIDRTRVSATHGVGGGGVGPGLGWGTMHSRRYACFCLRLLQYPESRCELGYLRTCVPHPCTSSCSIDWHYNYNHYHAA
ncbi:hypothetical protein B0H11DRAFT_236326 [Mycena galericulata]|nr:hypothetical protein B0H11DRAFT_236326 [Mycena galericulata]